MGSAISLLHSTAEQMKALGSLLGREGAVEWRASWVGRVGGVT